jgi:hypothetical protein
MRLLAECVLSRSLAHHPRRYRGERAVWLHDDGQLHAAVLKPSPDQYCLAEPRMEPIVDPSLNQMFVGNMSPFPEVLNHTNIDILLKQVSRKRVPPMSQAT